MHSFPLPPFIINKSPSQTLNNSTSFFNSSNWLAIVEFFCLFVVVPLVLFVIAIVLPTIQDLYEKYKHLKAQKVLLSGLPKFNYKSIDGDDNGEGKVAVVPPKCIVCMSQVEQGEEVRVLPNCAHIFHAYCVDLWLYSHSNCPLCRTRVAPHCI